MDGAALNSAVAAWLASARPRDYIALQAYLAPAGETSSVLQEIRGTLLKKTGLATTLGFGPRFLHSTGQLHKGGPDEALVLQIVDRPEDDIPVPETGTTFGALIRAQATGDFLALKRRGRRVLRVDLGPDVPGGLRRLGKAIRI
jgi:transaldolase/glucose-6-phosphate isomerase